VVVDDGAGGRIEVRPPVGGDYLFDWTVAPGAPTGPAHRHPAHEERFEMLEGRLAIRAGRRWRELAAGESMAVPPGTAHALANRSGRPARVRVTVSPGAGAAEFFPRMLELYRTRHGIGRLVALAGHFHDRRDFVRFGFPYAAGVAVLRRLRRR